MSSETPDGPNSRNPDARNDEQLIEASMATMGRLSTELNSLLARLGSEPAAVVSSVFTDWVTLVGEHVAQHVTPIKLENSRLVVEVSESSWATQMRFLEPQLLTTLSTTTRSNIVGIDVRVKRNSRSK
jgi:predicted nucleic acid-binding Zn ribbon protein